MAATHFIKLVVLDQAFEFGIGAKRTALGELGVRHLWMQTTGLYDVGRRGGNGISLVECFRALCLEAQARGEEEHPHDRETYLLAWIELLSERGPLRQQFGLTPADRVFLGLVHLVHKAPADMPDQRFDLFHGHAFALHPAWGLLIRTPTGQRLIGECVTAILALPEVPEAPRLLAAARNLPAFRAVMNAAQKAVNVYADQRALMAMERKPERAWSPERLETRPLARSNRSTGMRVRMGWFSSRRLGEE